MSVQEEDLKDSVLLVFANKQDIRGALNAAQVSEALGLSSIRSRQWSIQETSATQGKGLHEGFDWLVNCIKGGSPAVAAPAPKASVPAPVAVAGT